MRTVALTDIGLIRKNNQDFFDTRFLSNDVAFAVVCDGMGGNSGGEVASKMAVEKICNRLEEKYNDLMKDSMLEKLLVSSAYVANDDIFNFALEHKELSGMGTTLIITFIRGNFVHLVNVGDSRAYLISDTQITQLTKDHSMVQELFERGQITSLQARLHPNKNIITRALGVDDFVEADYFKTEIHYGEKLLLCTDGFSNYIDNSKIFEMVKNTDFNFLAREAVTFAKNAGGRDNITVVAFER